MDDYYAAHAILHKQMIADHILDFIKSHSWSHAGWALLPGYVHWSVTGGTAVAESQWNQDIDPEKEKLDSREREHSSPAAPKGHLCLNGSTQFHPQFLLSSLLLYPPPLFLPCVLLAMCCSHRVNEPWMVRGTTLNSSSEDPCIVFRL